MRILVTGASGQLGAYVLDALLASGHEPIAWSGSQQGEYGSVSFRSVQMEHFGLLGDVLSGFDPDAVLHLAAVSSVADVRRDPDRAEAVNVGATTAISSWCTERARRLVFTSTDLVFSGERSWNREDDPAAPTTDYGRTKRLAEAMVLSSPNGLVARLPLMFGPSRRGHPAYFDRAIASLQTGETRSFFEDEFRTPLDYATAASALVRLIESDATGLLHVAGSERVSRFDLMRRVAQALGIDPRLILPNRREDVSSPEPRPADVSLDTTRLTTLLPDLARPTIEDAAQSWSS